MGKRPYGEGSKRVMKVFQEVSGRLTVQDIAELANLPAKTVTNALKGLTTRGEVIRVSQFRPYTYTVPEPVTRPEVILVPTPIQDIIELNGVKYIPLGFVPSPSQATNKQLTIVKWCVEHNKAGVFTTATFAEDLSDTFIIGGFLYLEEKP